MMIDSVGRFLERLHVKAQDDDPWAMFLELVLGVLIVAVGMGVLFVAFLGLVWLVVSWPSSGALILFGAIVAAFLGLVAVAVRRVNE